jgi:hypothetical protein
LIALLMIVRKKGSPETSAAIVGVKSSQGRDKFGPVRGGGEGASTGSEA